MLCGLALSMPAGAALIVDDVDHTVKDGDAAYVLAVGGNDTGDGRYTGTLTFTVSGTAASVAVEPTNTDFSMEVSSYSPIFVPLGGIAPAASQAATGLQPGQTVNLDFFDGAIASGSATAAVYESSIVTAWDDPGDSAYLAWRIALAGVNGGSAFGWVELTRGSLTIGASGYQNTLDAGAPIRTVPAPAPLLLGLAGLAGLLLSRRRV
jgi:hypothetical protein